MHCVGRAGLGMHLGGRGQMQRGRGAPCAPGRAQDAAQRERRERPAGVGVDQLLQAPFVVLIGAGDDAPDGAEAASDLAQVVQRAA